MTTERTAHDVWDDIDRTLEALAHQQEARVLALARRLRGDLTAEDLRNAHDFRELDDHDFHYEDGTLAGLLAALSAVRARRNEAKP
jgi:hypothetical protein